MRIQHARRDYAELLLDIYNGGNATRQAREQIVENLQRNLSGLGACGRLTYCVSKAYEHDLEKVQAMPEPEVVGLAVKGSDDKNLRHALLVQASVIDTHYSQILNL
tara:strand:+ start:163 stop:480 length:318 start_codon:yes stop_codon:yes gene_type:complete